MMHDSACVVRITNPASYKLNRNLKEKTKHFLRGKKCIYINNSLFLKNKISFYLYVRTKVFGFRLGIFTFPLFLSKHNSLRG